MTRASSFADDPALYGWLLRRATSGWRRGAWQRRFFSLGTQEFLSALLPPGPAHEGGPLCSNADPSAPAARRHHPSANADGLYLDDVDGHKQHSFSIAVPGGFEYDLAAHSAAKKEGMVGSISTSGARRRLRYQHRRRRRRGPPAASRARRRAPRCRAAAGAAPLPAVRAPPPPANPFAAPANPSRRHSPRPARLSPLGDHVSRAGARRSLHKDRPRNYLQTPSRRRRTHLQARRRRPTPSSLAAADKVGPRAREAATQTSDPLGITSSRPRARPARRLERRVSRRIWWRAVRGVCRRRRRARGPLRVRRFDELYKRTQGVLLDDAGRRLCRHVVHLDCLKICLPTEIIMERRCVRFVEGRVHGQRPSIFDDARRWFDLVDLDRSGQVAAEDVLATLKAQLPVDEEAIDARWDSLWAHFDHNGSGTLAYDDIAAPERGLVAF